MPISSPEQYQLKPIDVFFNVLEKSPFGIYAKDVMALVNGQTNEIATVLSKLPKDEFIDFVHVLHLVLFMKKNEDDLSVPMSWTPVTDAMSALLKAQPLDEVLNLISGSITDVLTAHPVDMDRGIMSAYKQSFAILSQEWSQQKKIYAKLDEPGLKITMRTELNERLTQLQNISRKLLHTSNYRPKRIRPESEQRHLSRAIKDYESHIIAHWSKLICIIQVMCLQGLLAEKINANLIPVSPYKRFLDLEHTDETLAVLKAISELRNDPRFSKIIEIRHALTYQIETWRGDMDGNPFVSAMTVAQSTAYGRKRCFERLSADEAVIRYSHPSETFKRLETQMKHELETIKKTGEAAWKTYIAQQEEAAWPPVSIYSGLCYYRMVEMTEAAETFSRTGEDLSQLHTGFKDAEAFLNATKVLEEIECCVGLKDGVWSHYRQLVKTRDLSLGRPHIRRGESHHLDLVLECARLLGIAPKTAFDDLSDQEQIDFFKACIQGFQSQNIPADHLTEHNKTLVTEYQKIIYIDANCTLIQSDSGEKTRSLEASLCLLKSVSTLIGHQGKVSLLCESEKGMLGAIKFMESAGGTDTFHKVLMMCAGSDSQKKLGPFYSAYLIHRFFATAYTYKIDAFFGAGDSPLRSSLHQPVCGMRTFQPGSRKRHYFGAEIFTYLSDRLAAHLNGLHRYKQGSGGLSQDEWQIFDKFAQHMYHAYQTAIQNREQLATGMQSLSSIVTTYFSRPAKKATGTGAVLDQLRAIDSGRAQVILNSFDPQLAGLKEGVDAFLNACEDRMACQHFFTQTEIGQAILETLRFYAQMLDDTIPTASELRQVSQGDILAAYQALSGQPLNVEGDRLLHLVRQFWGQTSRDKNFSEHNAQTLMLFGANWMI